MIASSHCCVNEVLCHHLKPAAPLAGKTQNQLPPIVSALNFPPKLEYLSLSNFLLPLLLDLLWSRAISCLLNPHLLWAVTQPSWSLKASEATLSQHNTLVNYEQVPKQEPQSDNQDKLSCRSFMRGINECLGSTSANHPHYRYCLNWGIILQAEQKRCFRV